MKFVGFIVTFFLPLFVCAQVRIAFDFGNQPVAFGVKHIENSLQQAGQKIQKIKLSAAADKANILIRILSSGQNSSITKEGFEIDNHKNILTISAIDAAGAMYGALHVAEQIEMGKKWQSISGKKTGFLFYCPCIKI